MKKYQFLSKSIVGWVRAVLALGLGALLADLASAAELSHYGLTKNRGYLQTGPVPANPPVVEGFNFHPFVYLTTEGSILFGTVSGPGITPGIVAATGDDPKLLDSSEGFTSQNELDQGRPNGTYAFQLITSNGGQINASLLLDGDAYPTAPALDNFAAAQDIDRTKAFVLQWTKPAQLDAADYVVVSILADGAVIFSSPMPWQPGALPGTTTSLSLPANTLPTPADLTGQIQFFNVTTRDTQTIVGATGLAGYVAATTFSLELHGTGGGGDDTTSPTLSASQPAFGASGVPTTSPVLFIFSEAMKPQQVINWFGPPNPASFTYGWSADGKVLTCTYPGGFPASTSITWQLVASAFEDLAGNQLTGNNTAGAFTTATGGTLPCVNGLPGQANSFLAGRFENFAQASAGAPTQDAALLDDNSPASFLASFSSSSSAAVSMVELLLPNGQRKTLPAQFGHYFLLEAFTSEAALLATYPNGPYSGEVTLSGGTKSSQTVTLGNPPNTPHNSNFEPAQAIDPAAPFTLSWDPLTGVTANDRIEIVIYDTNGAILLQLPDECAKPPKPLAPTATSISIPANLLKLASTYPVELTFTRVSEVKSNAAPAFVMVGAFLKTTRFNIKTIGGGTPNSQPVITAYRIANDGKFEADITGAVGHTINLEASDLSSGWTTVGSAVVPAPGKVTIKDPRAANVKSQVYRARSE